ncbi:MAG: phosphotransferase, partial [Phycisphaerales bacterium]|nr:phosphotransferase [Phycisphaerales bacterium]
MSRSQKPDAIFAPFELVMALSHYNIGAISAVEPFNRGSATSPKIILTTPSREYLLKRRAPGKDDLELLQVSHGIQLHLANQQFPLPHLILTAENSRSWVQIDQSVYELFEFLPGEAFNYEKPATYNTGRTLALFHKLTRDYPMIPEYSERGCYHANRSIDVAFKKIKSIIQADSHLTADQKAAAVAQQASLQETYHKAKDKVHAAGLANWPLSIVHADFHPGNCLYKGEHVVGVIDFDSCRAQQPILDTANAALQYSIRLGSGDPR